MSLTLEKYSEKSIAVFGEETKNCKEDLKKMGGKYNANLKGRAGWIFSLKNEEKVKQFVETACLKTSKGSVPQTPNLQISKQTVSSKSNLETIISDIEKLSNSDREKIIQKLTESKNNLLNQPITNVAIDFSDDEEYDYNPKRMLV